MFDENELNKLARLCRLQCTDEEKSTLIEHMSKILSYIELLNEVDTGSATACKHVTEGSHVLRDDVVENLLSREDFLSNVPSHVGGMVRVPPIIKF